MTSPDIAALNERFGLQRRLRFAEGKSGLIKGELTFDEARLELYLPQQQTSEITFDSEVDRVYQAPPASIDLLDQGRDINTSIESWGNNNLVIWNPGEQKARQMNDFDDRGFEQMICIEPANALAQSITLLPGEYHRLGQEIKATRT